MTQTIVCVKWGDKYGPNYVNALYKGLVKWLDVPFKLVCFTDDNKHLEENIITRELVHSLPGEGWWHKLFLFSGESQLSGRITFFDLDTIFVGSLNNIVQREEPFIVLHDFYRSMRGNPTAVGSGMLAWNHEQYRWVWDRYWKDREKIYEKYDILGDQAFLEDVVLERAYWQDLLPNQIVSYKAHKCSVKLPEGARVVCYHGTPKPHETKHEWVRENWNG